MLCLCAPMPSDIWFKMFFKSPNSSLDHLPGVSLYSYRVQGSLQPVTLTTCWYPPILNARAMFDLLKRSESGQEKLLNISVLQFSNFSSKKSSMHLLMVSFLLQSLMLICFCMFKAKTYLTHMTNIWCTPRNIIQGCK